MSVAIFFGSLSDKPVMKKAAEILKKLEIPYKAFCISAHRLSDELEKTLKSPVFKEVEVIVAGAGLAAHLPGVLASKTSIPVIGVPINGALDGLDSLLSIVQMPKEVPVATVGIDNATNAAILAIQILGLKYPAYRERLEKYKKETREKLSTQIYQEDL